MLISSLINILFPQYCFSCRKLGSPLCRTCAKKIKFSSGKIELQPEIDGLYACFSYSGVVKNTIRAGKYFSIRGALELMCSYVVKHPLRLFASRCLSICPSCVLVSVPLHKRRFSERGFNQSEVIARCLSLQLKIPVRNDLVVRQRYTSSQAQLPKKEREQNLKGAFEYTGPPHAPEGVLIIDDVWTTGSTVREITRVLRLAGVKYVWALTLAR